MDENERTADEGYSDEDYPYEIVLRVTVNAIGPILDRESAAFELQDWIESVGVSYLSNAIESWTRVPDA
jgi:hypothetical protein